MSLTINVCPKSNPTTGCQEHTLASDNGNQEIDTKAEAEEALAFVSDQDTATAGGKTYTRDDLIKIRDNNTGSNGGGSGQGQGVSHGVRIGGGYSFGAGDKGHSGGSFRIGYVLGVPIAGDANSTQVYVDPSIEFTSGNRKTEFTTPGGEKVTSAYTPVGGLLGVAARLVPSFLDHRLSFSLGTNFGFGGFFTSDSKSVSLPTSCTPGDDSGFGRGECEPTAGPRTGNSGKAGLENFDVGSARGTSGSYFSFGFPITVGVDILRGTWGTMSLAPVYEPSVRIIMPGDGHGFSHWEHSLLATMTGRFGGSAAFGNKPADFDQDGVPDSLDKCPGTPIGTKVDAMGCPATDGTQKEPVPISPGAGDVPIPQGYQF